MPSNEEQKVKSFWESRATEKDIPQTEVTHRDVWQRWLEVEVIKKHITGYGRVLDVGCGNGYTTKLIAPLVEQVVGIDYSEEMIRRAEEESIRQSSSDNEQIVFRVCDVRQLSPALLGVFDAVISERCLINLPSWEDQKQAIANIASILRPGGRFVFIEGSRNGRRRLNELRVAVGLGEMPPVWHNVDFDDEATLEYLAESFRVECRLHFGVYDFVSRVVHPLMVAPERPKYEARINEVAAKLALDVQEMGRVSRVLALILRRLPA